MATRGGPDLVRTDKQALSQIVAQTSSATPAAPISSKPEPQCKECGDTGFVLSPKGAKRCGCIIEKAICAQLPPRYHKARMCDFSRKLEEALLNLIKTRGDGLFVQGPVGSGKTHLAAAILRAVLEAGGSAKFLRASDMYAKVRATYGAKNDIAVDYETEISLMASYVSTALLILDDLAAGSLSDHERRIALEVIDRRMNDGRSTIITSNWSREEIGAKMDERIASRLLAFQAVALTGADHRKRG